MQIVIASGKGGVGKSIFTSSLIYFLKDKFKLVAVDADAEAPNLHLIFNVDNWLEEKSLTGGKIAEINSEKCINCSLCIKNCTYKAVKKLSNKEKPVVNKLICEGCGACKIVCPVKAVTLKEAKSGTIRKTVTTYGFPLISAQLDVGRPNSGKLVTEEKKWAKETADEKTHILVDSAAGIGCQVIASVSGADLAILVAEPTKSSLHDLKRVHKVVEHFKIPSLFVVNKYNLNPSFKGIEKYAEEKKSKILGKIPYDTKVPQSIILRRPLPEVFPETEASKVIKEIGKKIECILREE